MWPPNPCVIVVFMWSLARVGKPQPQRPTAPTTCTNDRLSLAHFNIRADSRWVKDYVIKISNLCVSKAKVLVLVNHASMTLAIPHPHTRRLPWLTKEWIWNTMWVTVTKKNWTNWPSCSWQFNRCPKVKFLGFLWFITYWHTKKVTYILEAGAFALEGQEGN